MFNLLIICTCFYVRVCKGRRVSFYCSLVIQSIINRFLEADFYFDDNSKIEYILCR